MYSFVVALFILVLTTHSIDAMECDYYNKTLCMNEGLGCNGSELCKPTESEKGNMCYVLSQNTTEGFVLTLKGCWVGGQQDSCSNHKQPCVETRRDPNIQLSFCCCEGDMCNVNLTHVPVNMAAHPTVTSIQLPPSTALKPDSEGSQALNTLVYTMTPFLALTLIVAGLYCFYRKRRMGHFNELPTFEPSPLPPPSPKVGLRPIQLQEVKAHGRFGAVWKAKMLTEMVAVKIFPPQDKNSWLVEQEIFRLPQMKHPHLLYYYGSEKHGENLQAEYWLITAYHENGSLCDYLKANLVSWNEVLSICDSIARGLMHLHEEMSPLKGESYKPAVAHRDFKSKNVLLKSDMTACVADFGLALIFHHNNSPGDTHGQVGTRRYMAPEVLEGAISFNRDAFLRIDMYAAGLVLWEVISRCSAQEGPVDEYRLPFEEEIGQHPSLEDMQDLVVQKKVRPKFKEHWRKHYGLDSLCDTIEECWDHDTDARLSASCVQERISLMCTASQTTLNLADC